MPITISKQNNYGALADEKTEIDKEDIDEPKGCWQRFYPSGFKQELKELLKLVVPLVLTQLFQYMIGPVSIMFCGHLGETELAAVALANSFINVTGITIALGLATACDTLFSQVYGSSNRKRLGTELQRSLLILCLAVLPCWAIHLNMEALLRLLGQDPVVSRKTAEYLLVFMPGVLFFFVYICLSKYLQNQNITLPNLIIGAISNAVNALLHYLFVHVADLGTEGSAIAQVLSYFTMMLLTLIYIVTRNISKETWQGWNTDCFKDWGEFIKLGSFGLVMLCVEYWSFEIGTITAGLLSTSYLGAMSVIFQLETFAYMLPLGTGIAASIRVGQFLGAGDSAGAQTSARVTMTSICVAEIGVAILFLSLRNYLPLVFTNVPDVIELVRGVLYVCAIYQISDGLAGTGAGILRGQGRQKMGAAIVFTGYAVALSVGTPLMLFTSLRLYAFWGGLAIALTFEGIIFALIIHNNDWDKQALDALVRAKVIANTNIGEDSIDSSSEKLHLIRESSQLNSSSLDGHYIVSTTPDEKEESYDSQDFAPITRELIIKRVLILVGAIMILIGGVLLRVLYTSKLELPVPVPTPSLALNESHSWTHFPLYTKLASLPDVLHNSSIPFL